MRAIWLPDVLRSAGCTVAEVPGWQTCGRELATIRGVVLHDTVTRPSTSDEAVVKLLRDGRPDLAGPLSQLGLDRAGRFRLVAAGKANHNGYGTWGNDTIGIEVFCAGGLKGAEEPWNEAQFAAAARGTAAILAHLRIGPGCAKGHKETDPDRKIDPWGVDMARFRAAMTRPPATPDQGDDMLTFVLDCYELYLGISRAQVMADMQLRTDVDYHTWLLTSGQKTQEQKRAEFADWARKATPARL